MRCEKELESELSFGECIEVIRQFKLTGGKRVVFTGGEVVLKPRFPQILEFSKTVGLDNIIITNGTMWSEELIEQVSKFADCIQISIDGYDEESNSKVRGKGVFSKALECVEKFIRKGVEVVISVTPLYGYEKEAQRYIDFGKTLVKKYEGERFFVVFADGLYKGREIQTSMRQNEKYALDSLSILEGIYPGYIIGSFANLHSDPVQNCGYGKIVVDSNGNFAFCSCVKDIPHLGNVRNIPFDRIVEMARKIEKHTCVSNIEPCKDCDFRFVCGGGCRMDNCYNSDVISDINNLPALSLRYECNEQKKLSLLEMMAKSVDKII